MRWCHLPFTGVLLASLALDAQAGALKVESSHDRVEIRRGGTRLTYWWLKPDEMLLLQVVGPTNLGIRFRRVTTPDSTTAPVDLTVVRDDQEQGTVRFRPPGPDDVVVAGGQEIAPSGALSGEVLVKIEIPAGPHRYRVLASGPGRGALVFPFLGLATQGQVVVATPGKMGKSAEVAETQPRETGGDKVARKAWAPPVAPPPDVLAPVPVLPQQPPRGVIHEIPAVRTGAERFGPGTRVSGSVTGLLLLGTTAVLISGAAIHDQAKHEPVQLPAGELFDRAERTYEASAVLGGLTAAAAVVTLVFFLVEGPSATAPGDLTLRF